MMTVKRVEDNPRLDAWLAEVVPALREGKTPPAPPKGLGILAGGVQCSPSVMDKEGPPVPKRCAPGWSCIRYVVNREGGRGKVRGHIHLRRRDEGGVHALIVLDMAKGGPLAFAARQGWRGNAHEPTPDALLMALGKAMALAIGSTKGQTLRDRIPEITEYMDKYRRASYQGKAKAAVKHFAALPEGERAIFSWEWVKKRIPNKWTAKREEGDALPAKAMTTPKPSRKAVRRKAKAIAH